MGASATVTGPRPRSRSACTPAASRCAALPPASAARRDSASRAEVRLREPPTMYQGFGLRRNYCRFRVTPEVTFALGVNVPVAWPGGTTPSGGPSRVVFLASRTFSS